MAEAGVATWVETGVVLPAVAMTFGAIDRVGVGRILSATGGGVWNIKYPPTAMTPRITITTTTDANPFWLAIITLLV